MKRKLKEEVQERQQRRRNADKRKEEAAKKAANTLNSQKSRSKKEAMDRARDAGLNAKHIEEAGKRAAKVRHDLGSAQDARDEATIYIQQAQQTEAMKLARRAGFVEDDVLQVAMAADEVYQAGGSFEEGWAASKACIKQIQARDEDLSLDGGDDENQPPSTPHNGIMTPPRSARSSARTSARKQQIRSAIKTNLSSAMKKKADTRKELGELAKSQIKQADETAKTREAICQNDKEEQELLRMERELLQQEAEEENDGICKSLFLDERKPSPKY